MSRERKKESHGVEFPLGMENVSNIGNMKVFGFANTEPVIQNVKTEGTINIAIGWDSSYSLSIEYHVPLKMLESTITELNNKKLSIGWKLKENDMTSDNGTPVSSTSRLVAVQAPAGSRPPNNRNVGSSQTSTTPQTNTSKPPQSIWTTHTIIF
jgi:hypothetical protein